jgi:hypothetical protein
MVASCMGNAKEAEPSMEINDNDDNQSEATIPRGRPYCKKQKQG